jgi:hypothetical protein
MEHKHAAILRAIADGKAVQARLSGCKTWTTADPVELATCNPLAQPFYEWRIKPKTININGHEVPAPLAYLENGAEYFTFSIFEGVPTSEHHCNRYQELGENHCRMGIAHATQEAAEAHARALLSFTAKDQA